MELLVAISILVILMAVGARMMNFSVEDRRTREAARAINVYVASARNRAMETGRPCGVMLRRLESQPLCVVGMEQVEVPPPYAGDTVQAATRLQLTSGGVAARFGVGDFSDGLVRLHDLMQLNHQGPLYEITQGPDSNSDGFLDFNDKDAVDKDGDGFIDDYFFILQVDLRQGQMLPWPSAPASSPAMPYQIIRQPTKSAAAGLQLPVRAVIDLQFSGTDEDSIGAVSDQPVYIMFSPNGSLERFYHPGHGGGVHPGTEPIYLLVGKQERVPAGSAEDGLANWQDVKNLWVTLNPQTGLVTTTEVAKGANHVESRSNAREGQSMGGR